MFDKTNVNEGKWSISDSEHQIRQGKKLIMIIWITTCDHIYTWERLRSISSNRRVNIRLKLSYILLMFINLFQLIKYCII